MQDYKKYLPFLAIGGVVVWLVLKLSKSGSANQTVNRVIPVQNPTDNNALAETQASFELGKIKLANELSIADKQVNAEQTRLELANKALDIQGQYGLKALEIQAASTNAQNQTQADLARIALDSSLYDTQLRASAANELYRQQSQSSLLNSLLGVGSGILQSLLKQNQQSSQQRPQSGGGGIGGGSSSPQSPQQSAQNQARARQSALAAIGNWLTRNSNYFSPITFQDYDSLGYVTGYDLSDFYQREIDAYDRYLDYDPPTLFGEPVGSVSSSFEFSGIGWDDYARSLGFDNFDDWYNDEYGAF